MILKRSFARYVSSPRYSVLRYLLKYVICFSQLRSKLCEMIDSLLCVNDYLIVIESHHSSY